MCRARHKSVAAKTAVSIGGIHQGDVIVTQRCIEGHKREALGARLCDEQPVKWIPMMLRQFKRARETFYGVHDLPHGNFAIQAA